MRYLLDTNALLFALFAPDKLSENAAAVIRTEPELYVSIVSLWEITIKRGLGKLKMPKSAEELSVICNQMGISILQIEPSHLDEVYGLEMIHRDPFDRLIIAQAQKEKMSIVTSASVIPRYNVRVVW